VALPTSPGLATAFNGEGADGLDYLQNLTFTNFKPSVAAILGDERADKQARHFGRPGFTIRVSTGEKPEDFTFVPFPLGQGVFQLDRTFTDVADARFQQFNRSPQLFSQPQEVDAGFIEVAIPYTALGGLQPGDEITIGAVVGTKGVYGNQFRQLDTTHLGNGLTSRKDLVFQLDIYQLEGLKVRLAIDTDPDNDGLLTAREMELGTIRTSATPTAICCRTAGKSPAASTRSSTTATRRWRSTPTATASALPTNSPPAPTRSTATPISRYRLKRPTTASASTGTPSRVPLIRSSPPGRHPARTRRLARRKNSRARPLPKWSWPFPPLNSTNRPHITGCN